MILDMKINERNLVAYSLSRDHIDREGYLLLRGESKIFHRRWFVLKGNLLFYFEKKLDKDPLGVIILEGCTTELAESEDDNRFIFKLIFHGQNVRTYEFAAETPEQPEIWMKAFSRASHDYMKLMVAELQKQLFEIEATKDSSDSGVMVPSSRKHRENPFNRNSEVSHGDLWKGNEVCQNAFALLSRSSSNDLSGSTRDSFPVGVPSRPAPAPPARKTSNKPSPYKSFLTLHKEYGEPILSDRKNYTTTILSCTLGEVKTENLIDL